jgi:hypothetical protein
MGAAGEWNDEKSFEFRFASKHYPGHFSLARPTVGRGTKG